MNRRRNSIIIVLLLVFSLAYASFAFTDRQIIDDLGQQNETEQNEENTTDNTNPNTIQTITPGGLNFGPQTEVTAPEVTEPEDTTAPTGEVEYSVVTLTNGDVVVLITTDEPIETPEGWRSIEDNTVFTKTFTDNGEEEVTLTDLVGNESLVDVKVSNIDKVVPVVENIVVDKEVTKAKTIEISGKIFDENIRYSSVRIYNAANESIYKETVYENVDGLIDTVDISSFADGVYRVRVKAYDFAGNDNQAYANFEIDRTAPSTVIISPLEGAINPTEFTVKLTDKNLLRRIDYSLWLNNNQDQVLIKGEWLDKLNVTELNKTYQLPTLKDGEYTLRVTASDELRNVINAKSINFIIDTSAPYASNIVVSPLFNGNTGRENVRVEFDLNDLSGIDLAGTGTFVMFADGPGTSYQLKESEKLTPELISGNRYFVEFDSTKFVKDNYVGNYNLQFTMTDILGNGTSSKPKDFRPILIDNSGPSVSLKSPLTNSSISQATRFEVNTFDDTGIKEGYIQFQTDDFQKDYPLNKDSSDVWYVDVDVDELPNGELKIHARMVDLLGNPRFTKNIGVVRIDTIPPEITFSGAEKLKLGLFDLTFNISNSYDAFDDVDGNIKDSVEVEVDSGLTRVQGSYYKLFEGWKTYDLLVPVDFQPGSYKIKFTVTDSAGNTTERVRTLTYGSELLKLIELLS